MATGEQYSTPIPWAGLVCIKDRKLLTLRESDKDFDLVPGGKKVGDETDVETIARETMEELGVGAVIDSLEDFYYFQEPSAHTGQLIGFKLYKGDIDSEPNPDNLPNKTTSFGYINSNYKSEGYKAGALLNVLVPKLIELNLID